MIGAAACWASRKRRAPSCHRDHGECDRPIWLHDCFVSSLCNRGAGCFRGHSAAGGPCRFGSTPTSAFGNKFADQVASTAALIAFRVAGGGSCPRVTLAGIAALLAHVSGADTPS
jgi:hypothetical protein